MRFSTHLGYALLATAGLGFIGTAVAAPPEPVLPAPEKISPHVYAWIGPLDGPSKENQGYRMNMAFIVGSEAIAVVETGYTEAMGEQMLAHIRKISDKPVKYAINSNSQPDRFMGNPAFRRAGISIIAHRLSAERMAAEGANFAANIERILEKPAGSIKIPQPPDRIIDQELELSLGNISLRIINLGPAHTPAQLAIAVLADNIVYAGDSLYGQRLLAITPASNTASWIAAYNILRKFGNATFIPGHGEPGPLSKFEFPTHDYLALLLTHMNKMVAEGVDLQDAIDRLDQSKFAELANFEQLAGRNASLVYLEREAAAF